MNKQINVKYFILAALVSVIVLSAFSCRHKLEQDEPLKVKVDVNVRIDVYQHASDVLDFIDGESDQLPEPGAGPEPAADTTSFFDNVIDLAFGVSPAYAGTSSETSRYRELAESMRKRAKVVQKYKTDLSVGENRKGLLTVRENKKMKSNKDYASAVKKTVKAENHDRTEFYKENAKKLNKSYAEIVNVFTAARRKKAQKGEWLEIKKENKWTWTKKK
jgi:uncharacterized protein DUF1318